MKLLIKNFLTPKTIELLGVVILLIVLFATRFINLGYSDYIGDEHKALIKLEKNESISQFFLSRRKGPMQFFISYIPYLVTNDYRNELAERIPFAIINVAAVIIFYLYVKRSTTSSLTAFIAAYLLAINGFIVGFSRIVQYQNLNLLFSFCTLLFYAKAVDACKNEGEDEDASSERRLLKFSLLGSFTFCLSMFSHWDAIFIVPPVLIYVVIILRSKRVAAISKKKFVTYNFLLILIILGSFMLPYTKYQLSDQSNREYFQRRVEFGYLNYERYIELIRLYNPFVTFSFLMSLGFIGMLFIKKTYYFSLWYIFAYLTFELFVRKPGTHIYNFIIPLIILAAS